jgi:hypothetical protein
MGHASDCARHNAPAFPAGPCDCDVGKRLMEVRSHLLSLTSTMDDVMDILVDFDQENLIVRLNKGISA